MADETVEVVQDQPEAPPDTGGASPEPVHDVDPVVEPEPEPEPEPELDDYTPHWLDDPEPSPAPSREPEYPAAPPPGAYQAPPGYGPPRYDQYGQPQKPQGFEGWSQDQQHRWFNQFIANPEGQIENVTRRTLEQEMAGYLGPMAQNMQQLRQELYQRDFQAAAQEVTSMDRSIKGVYQSLNKDQAYRKDKTVRERTDQFIRGQRERARQALQQGDFNTARAISNTISNDLFPALLATAMKQSIGYRDSSANPAMSPKANVEQASSKTDRGEPQIPQEARDALYSRLPASVAKKKEKEMIAAMKRGVKW
jgi:hypothetical protein